MGVHFDCAMVGDLSSTYFGFVFSSSVNCGVGGTLNQIATAIERVITN